MPWKRSKGKRSRDDDTDDNSDTRPRNKPKSSNTEITTKRQVDDEGNPFWELGGRLRRATVSKFEGSVFVNIREHYKKDGNVLPGRKGISLSVDQFNAMMTILPQLHQTLSKETEAEIVTPEFGSPILKIKKEKMRDEESNTEEEGNLREIMTPEFGSPILKIKKEMRDEESNTEEEGNVREIVTPEFGSPILKIKKEKIRDGESNTEEEDVREQTPERNQKKESQVFTKKKEVKRVGVMQPD